LLGDIGLSFLFPRGWGEGAGCVVFERTQGYRREASLRVCRCMRWS